MERIEYTCCCCGALLSGPRCLSCEHDKCDTCPVYVPNPSYAELEAKLQAYREAGALEALHSVCRAFSITRESDEAEQAAIVAAYDKCRAAIAKLEAIEK